MSFLIKSLNDLILNEYGGEGFRKISFDTQLHFTNLSDWDDSHAMVEFKEFAGKWLIRKESWEIE